jgi:hypothetical protein
MAAERDTQYDSTNIITGSALLYTAALGAAIPPMPPTGLPAPNPTIWTPLGYTDAGIKFAYDPTFKDVTVDEEMSAVDVLMTAEKLVISAGLAELTLANLQRALTSATLGAPVAAQAAVAFTGNITTGSPIIAAPSSVVGVSIGDVLTGVGIPAGASVLSFAGGITMSANATATTAALAITDASTPTAATQALQVGGNQTTTKRSYLLVGNGPNGMYRMIQVYKANATSKLDMTYKRGEKVMTPCEFTALALSTNPIGNKLFQIVDRTA